MRHEVIALHLQSEDVRWHRPVSPPPSQPESWIVATMGRVWLWLAWLAASFSALSTLYGVKSPTAAGFDWTREGLCFLAMMVLVGWSGTKPESRALETATFVLLTVTVMLLA